MAIRPLNRAREMRRGHTQGVTFIIPAVACRRVTAVRRKLVWGGWRGGTKDSSPLPYGKIVGLCIVGFIQPRVPGCLCSA